MNKPKLSSKLLRNNFRICEHINKFWETNIYFEIVLYPPPSPCVSISYSQAARRGASCCHMSHKGCLRRVWLFIRIFAVGINDLVLFAWIRSRQIPWGGVHTAKSSKASKTPEFFVLLNKIQNRCKTVMAIFVSKLYIKYCPWHIHVINNIFAV